MALFLWLLVGASVSYALSEFLFDDDTSSENDTGDTPDDGAATPVLDGFGHVGTEGADVYTYDGTANGEVTATIDARGGNDTIDLTSMFDEVALVGGQIMRGDGNDNISVEGEGSTISGGAGDDIIDGVLLASSVNGGDGDDRVRVTAGPGDASTVEGGDGNDTLDGSGSENIQLFGGAGDDLILTDGAPLVGTGHAILANGGDGNDTLTHSVDVFPLPSQNPGGIPASMTGGDGADRFEIVLTSDTGPSEGPPEDALVYQNEAAFITDFLPGTDQIIFDLSDLLPSYSASSLTQVEDTEAGTTELLLRLNGLDQGDQPVQVVRIVVAATDLQPQDIRFEGDFPFERIPVDRDAEMPPLPEGAIAVSDGAALTGGTGADVYGFAPGVAGPILTDITAGGGNDTIDLDSDAAFLRNATLDGGEGDDIITASGDMAIIQGGAGNDTLTVEETRGNPLFDETFVSGGEGDDVIASGIEFGTVEGGSGADSIALTNAISGVTARGGLGDDTITADVPDSGRMNYGIDGGEGDDLLKTEGYVISGTNDAFFASGGAGDDTLVHNVDVSPIATGANADGIRLTGGNGADLFDLVLTSGTEPPTPVDAAEARVIEAARITDFDPATDLLRIDLTDAMTGYSDVSGILTEDTARGTTTFLLRFVGDGGLEQDVTVAVTGTGLGWSDVDFVGAAPGSLTVG